jgi:hypothetical protein
VSKADEAAYERARIAAHMQNLGYSLVDGCSLEQRTLTRVLLEASIAVALRGTGEVPKSLAESATAWWKDRSDPKNRDRARTVWGAVIEAIGQSTLNGAAGASRTHNSAVGPDAFELVAEKLQMSRGTVARVFYEEMKRRRASDGWVPERKRKARATKPRG